MSSDNPDHSGIWCYLDRQSDTANTDLSKVARISAEIIRWLPLLASNDFLEEDDGLPPVA